MSDSRPGLAMPVAVRAFPFLFPPLYQHHPLLLPPSLPPFPHLWPSHFSALLSHASPLSPEALRQPWLPRPDEKSLKLLKSSPPDVKESRGKWRGGPLGCGECGREFGTASSLHSHLRSHAVTGCRCPVCGKSFSRHWLLQGHLRTHTGEKPFSCPVCNKAFADKSNLRAHVQTHSGLKPFVCSRCGKAFALKSYLSKHCESTCS